MFWTAKSITELWAVQVSLGIFPYVKTDVPAAAEKQVALKNTVQAAVVINPSTPISVLDEILPYLHMVLIMSVNPGFAGQKTVPTSFDKIKRMREKLDREGYSNVIIEVDGNCSFENVPKMYKAGAEYIIVEQDQWYEGDNLADAKKSRDYLKSLGY